MLPLFGIRYRVLARRAWPLLLSAAGILVTLVLFAADRVRPGAARRSARSLVTTGVLLTALGLVLRMFAVALPGVIVFATTDPTDLADALIQNAKAPARFAIGALAAFRLVPLLGAGVADAQHGPAGPGRRRRPQPGGPAAAVRARPRSRCWSGRSGGAPGWPWRWTRAASTPARPRTVARRQRFTRADALLIAGAVVLAAAALTRASRWAPSAR